MIYRHNVDKPH